MGLLPVETDVTVSFDRTVTEIPASCPPIIKEPPLAGSKRVRFHSQGTGDGLEGGIHQFLYGV
jgi:hypothetical protein